MIDFSEGDKEPMTEHLKRFKKIYIEKTALEDTASKRALQIFPKEKIHLIEEDSEKPLFKKATLEPEEIKESKKILHLKRFKGSFFKRCPGAKPKLLCCNYYVLNLGQNCEMDCSYCYLQSFINQPAVVIYTNIDKAFEELTALKKTHFKNYLRIGTGEQTDSLSLDDITLYSRRLIEFFNDCPHWLLEFKTKSDNIKNFKGIPSIGNTIVSWSVNPEFVVQKEEHETAGLQQRLSAAMKLRDKGFKISFHIDPLVYHEGWKENYRELIHQIATNFQPEELKHVSLGALRFQSRQKAIMRKRFGMQSLVCQGEFFKAGDGKMRYDYRLRQEMFQFVWREFKSHSKKWPLFLCMETPESWLNSAQTQPKKDSLIQKDFNLRTAASLTRRSSPARERVVGLKKA